FPCESLESRFEIKRVIAEAAGRPEQHAVNYAILRSMQKAVYGPEDVGHYALHKEHYCHFTSPIRRYPDLVVHRMIETLARGKRPADDMQQMLLLGDHCSEREQRAAAAERDLVKVKLLSYLASRLGMQMEAVITGVEEFGLFAQGTEMPAEGLVHVDTLDDDYYRFDRDTHSLAGSRGGNRYRLGDVIQVEVAHVDVDRRELDFRIVKRLGRGKRVARPERDSPRGRPSAGPPGSGSRPAHSGRGGSRGGARRQPGSGKPAPRRGPPKKGRR
ncbi:MAG: RNB domain-containing ribonuclease, partial [Pirellulaceae bacterium]|nr:RNB domain-containing ribonuclease [Pirellulaceae bacterium]